MDANELRQHLETYVGQRVRVTSTVVHSDHYVTLTSVAVTDDGRVWCYGDDGTAWVVTSEGLSVDVEPVQGTFDYAKKGEKDTIIRLTRGLYGPAPHELRQRCVCTRCTTRHTQDDTTRQEGYRAVFKAYYPTPDAIPEEPPQDTPSGPEGGLLKGW